MDRITCSAYAKVNLTLSVTGRQEDGYHTLESLFSSVSLSDTLTLQKSGEYCLLNSPSEIPLEQNIITRAYRALKAYCPTLGGITVTLQKEIPMQAGLGGGSADCAAFLKGANQLYELGLSDKELAAIGVTLGADVPFCLLGGAAIARGIGEELTPVPTSLSLPLVILQPQGVAFSTPEMYRRLDAPGALLTQRFSTPEAAAALTAGDTPMLLEHLYNIFEEAVQHEAIPQAKQDLLAAGASAALMTGTGSCVFGIFAAIGQAKEAAAALSSHYKAYACRTIPTSEVTTW